VIAIVVPEMRAKRKRPRRAADPDKLAATETAKRDFEAQIHDLTSNFDSAVPETIRDAMHPFELAGLCGDKPLSVVQKAITYCIQYLGGSASETEILAFLHRFWPQIVSKTDHAHRPVPDKRVLRINFTIQKEKRFLFVRSITDQQKWSLNTAKAPIEPNRRITDQIVPFQDRMLAVLRLHDEGLSLEELAELTREFAAADGMYQSLPLLQRVRTCLAVKRAVHEAHFDEKLQKWLSGPPRPERRKGRGEDGMANFVKSLHVRELTVTELWNILRDKGIY
jgi:hypothetical protein